MRRFVVVAAAAALFTSAEAAVAQFSPGARSVGMGGAGMIYARGVDAIEWNPANLALEGGWNVSIGEVGVTALVSGASMDDIQSLFDFELPVMGGETTLTDSAVVAGLPSSGITLSTTSEGYLSAMGIEESDGALPNAGDPLPSIGISFGNLGIRIRSRLMAETHLSKEVVDLIVNDFDESRIQEYQVGNTGFRTASFSEITAAYGSRIGERMAVGVGVRYVKGHKFTAGRFFEPVLDLVNDQIEIPSAAIEAPGGSGYGVDVGVALDLMMGFRVSASATNVIQKMTWDDALIGHEAIFLACDCPQSDFDGEPEDLIDQYQSAPLDPGSMSIYMAEVAKDFFHGAYFPTVFRLGAGWRAGGTSIELVGASVSPQGLQRNQWDERISLGLEQRLWFLTLRAGGAKGSDGLQALSGGVGLGLGPLHIDVSGGLMSGGFEFAEDLVQPEDVDYAGGHVTLSVQVLGGGN